MYGENLLILANLQKAKSLFVVEKTLYQALPPNLSGQTRVDLTVNGTLGLIMEEIVGIAETSKEMRTLGTEMGEIGMIESGETLVVDGLIAIPVERTNLL